MWLFITSSLAYCHCEVAQATAAISESLPGQGFEIATLRSRRLRWELPYVIARLRMQPHERQISTTTHLPSRYIPLSVRNTRCPVLLRSPSVPTLVSGCIEAGFHPPRDDCVGNSLTSLRGCACNRGNLRILGIDTDPNLPSRFSCVGLLIS